MTLVLASPAKINFFLRILGRRPDGFHEIATLIQAIDWCDTLTFELSDQDQLFCNDLVVPLDETNHVLRALHLFRQKTKKKFGLRVYLDKRIPLEAGLGGGSSNAATTLWALHKLFPNAATERDLCLWAAELGSDQSFFFSSGTALCRGRGEIVESLPLPLLPPVWVVKPNENLSTKEVYSHVRKEDWNYRKTTVEEDLAPFRNSRLTLFNDLEPSAMRVCPILQDWKQSLQRGGHRVVMSGSGSSFLVFSKTRPMVPVNIFCHQVFFLRRKPGQWYTPDINHRIHAVAAEQAPHAYDE